MGLHAIKNGAESCWHRNNKSNKNDSLGANSFRAFLIYLRILIIRDTLLQQDQINDYVNKEVPVVNNGYYQIVDKVQRILFLQSKDIN